MPHTNGRLVAFMGAERAHGVSPAIGDVGKVLEADYRSVHVIWRTGAATGKITVEHADDIEPHGISEVHASLEDSLSVGSLMVFSARRSYDEGGESAVLNAMAESGHLASFTDIAEEALALVANSVRHDASFRALATELEPEEVEGVVRLAAIALVRDAFGDADAED